LKLLPGATLKAPLTFEVNMQYAVMAVEASFFIASMIFDPGWKLPPTVSNENRCLWGLQQGSAFSS